VTSLEEQQLSPCAFPTVAERDQPLEERQESLQKLFQSTSIHYWTLVEFTHSQIEAEVDIANILQTYAEKKLIPGMFDGRRFHGTTVNSKKRVFRGNPAVEPRGSEVIPRTHQMQTRIFSATRFKDYRAPGRPEIPAHHGRWFDFNSAVFLCFALFQNFTPRNQ
jgi:hypothetical protein